MIIRTRAILLTLSVLLFSACSAKHQLAPVRDITPDTEAATHTVDKGETLYMIAWRYDKNVMELAEINRISDPYIIRPGQVLRLDGAGGFRHGPKLGPRNGSNNLAQSGSQSGSQYDQQAGHKQSSGWVLEKDSTPTASHTADAKPAHEKVADQSIHWQWPADGKPQKHLSQNDLSAGGIQNNGIDIYGVMNAPVYASADGQVVYSGDGLRGYGKLIILKHNDVYLSAYGHNSRLLVVEGEKVKVGQKIAEMGRSGADDVKLHFEIRKAGKPQDPMQYLPTRAGN